MVVTVTRASLSDQVADVLLARVRSGEWVLGARLPGENVLGPQLGVGRSTVREAIRQLVGRGVLTTRQGAGVFVSSLDVVEDWVAVVQRTDILEVVEARLAIETEAATLAAHRRTPSDLRAVRRALAGRDEHEVGEAYVDADTRFHRTVVIAAHNGLLLEIFDSLVPRIRAAMVAMLRSRTDFDAAADQCAHTRLVDEIANRDATRAAHASREHLSALLANLGG